jgi:viroplasmin and RNaseH domain-containing protein
MQKFKEEIEGFPASSYELCNSYAHAHKYLEEYLHREKGNQEMEMTAIALEALKKNMSSVMRI